MVGIGATSAKRAAVGSMAAPPAQGRRSTLSAGDVVHQSQERPGGQRLAVSDGSQGPEPSGECCFRAASAAMADQPDVFDHGVVEGVLGRHYALSGRVEILTSELEQTAEVRGFSRHGVTPDLVTLGKPMGNGFPIGAVVGRRAPMDRFGATARDSNTFAGTTVGIAAAAAVLTILERDGIPQNAVAMGERLRSGLAPLVDRGRGVLALRQAGLFLGVDIGRDGMPAASRRAMALAVVNAMRDDGVLVSTTGANEDTLKVRPPLVCRKTTWPASSKSSKPR